MSFQTDFFSSTSVRSANSFSSKEEIERHSSFSVITIATDKTPAPFTNVSVTAANVVTSDIFTQVAHTMVTGLKVRVLENASSTLPAGLVLATDYFVIRITADAFKLASSQALAIAGMAIDITAIGTGTMTVTPTLLDASFILQASNDGGSWANVTNGSFEIPATMTQFFEKGSAQYLFLRARLVVNSGQLSVSSIFNSNL